jgi:hypothetical protein
MIKAASVLEETEVMPSHPLCLGLIVRTGGASKLGRLYEGCAGGGMVAGKLKQQLEQVTAERNALMERLHAYESRAGR